jgi:hypothetical protein
MSNYYRRFTLNRLEDFQAWMIENYVTSPIETNVPGDVPLFKTRQPEQYRFDLFGWEPIQFITGSNNIHPAYFQITGLPQQEYPPVEMSKEVKQHVQNQRDTKQLVIWYMLKISMYIPIVNGADHVLELYDPVTGEFQDSVALTTPIIVSNDSHVKSVINNPEGAWHVDINFVTSHMYNQTGETIISRTRTAMKPVAFSIPDDQYLPD